MVLILILRANPGANLNSLWLDPPWCDGSEVLFTLAERPSRELPNPNHTRIIVFRCLLNPKFAPVVR
jgi:hypothetical protein